MIGFESFTIGAWLMDGLFTKHLDTAAASRGSKRKIGHKAGVRKFAAPIASAAVALQLQLFPILTAAQASTDLRLGAVSVDTAFSDIKGDTQFYWGQAIDQIRRMKVVEESPIQEPDPIF